MSFGYHILGSNSIKTLIWSEVLSIVGKDYQFAHSGILMTIVSVYSALLMLLLLSKCSIISV